jgi:hypothetical protein
LTLPHSGDITSKILLPFFPRGGLSLAHVLSSNFHDTYTFPAISFDKFLNKTIFICKVAKTPDEVKALIENGFEYVCDLDDLKFFKKRK